MSDKQMTPAQARVFVKQKAAEARQQAKAQRLKPQPPTREEIVQRLDKPRSSR